MPAETRDMEFDLQQLLNLVKRECPTVYEKISDEEVEDYIRNNEFGLAFDALTFNGIAYIDQLPPSVIDGIAQIIRSYDMHTVLTKAKTRERYDRFLTLADKRSESET